jgi:CDP-4-dehydro-6-deoxyglucose reductase
MPHMARIVAIDGYPTQRIRLEAENFRFTAGQYLEVIHPDGTRIPLSIASSPARLPELELHYRSTPGNPEAAAMDDLLHGTHLTIGPAQGAVHGPSDDIELVVVAGGSGAAQAFCLAEDRAERNPRGSNTRVLWCADHDDDLYDLERLGKLVAEVLVFVDDRRDTANKGIQWLTNHAHTLADAAVVIAGSPGFVYAVTDALTAAGVNPRALQSDVYAYAPR